MTEIELKEADILKFIFNKSRLGTEFVNSLDHVDSRTFYYLMDEYAKYRCRSFVKWVMEKSVQKIFIPNTTGNYLEDAEQAYNLFFQDQSKQK